MSKEVIMRFAIYSLISIMLGLLVAQGCGDAEHYPNTEISGGGGAIGIQPGTPCAIGAKIQCKQYLSKHGTVASCFIGTQSCIEGRWSECIPSGTAIVQ